MSVAGRVTIITGATGGLGRVVARTFAAEGATLALVSSDQARLDALAGELSLPAERCLTRAANLRDADQAAAAGRAIAARFGQAQILLHLVGGWLGGQALTATPASDLAAMLDQHVWSTFAAVQAFVPLLTASGWGRVVVVSSPVAATPKATLGAYAVAKAAEEAMILTLAREVEKFGVTANVLRVSAIDAQHEHERAPSWVKRDTTTPEEIAAAMLYLCSPEAGMVNGARISLAG
jgi:3-oxoacyl-[acyl-carrier protein] reductase